MQPIPPTTVLRHRKENLKKCSLRGLESRKDFVFFRYPSDSLPPFSGSIVLEMNAPPLSEMDEGLGLLVIDATWRHALKMLKNLEPALKGLVRRSIPGSFKTAYPRRQDDCPEPEYGLASIEAIYIAHYLLRRNVDGLLDHYHWKRAFFRAQSTLVDLRVVCLLTFSKF